MIPELLDSSAKAAMQRFKCLLREFYPSSHGKGFNEVNALRMFLNSLEASCNCVSWLELPFRSSTGERKAKANLIDGFALVRGQKKIFMIFCESKRIYYNPKQAEKQKKSIEADLRRLQKHWKEVCELYRSGANGKLQEKPLESYAVALVQYWSKVEEGQTIQEWKDRSIEEWFEKGIYQFAASAGEGTEDTPLDNWEICRENSNIMHWEGYNDTFHLLHGWTRLGELDAGC